MQRLGPDGHVGTQHVGIQMASTVGVGAVIVGTDQRIGPALGSGTSSVHGEEDVMGINGSSSRAREFLWNGWRSGRPRSASGVRPLNLAYLIDCTLPICSNCQYQQC